LNIVGYSPHNELDFSIEHVFGVPQAEYLMKDIEAFDGTCGEIVFEILQK
jgi:hypothetical protein